MFSTSPEWCVYTLRYGTSNSRFCENSKAGKAKLDKLYLFTTIVARFTEINMLDHKLGVHYGNMLAELNEMVFSATFLSGRQGRTEAQYRR